MFKNSNYFLTIVEEGNLSRAAEKLYITQPALTKYLHRLEKVLNAKLFDRSSSPLKLTPAGCCYLKYVNQVITLETCCIRELSEFQSESCSTLNIGITPFRGSYILPKLIPQYAKLYPHISVNVTEKKSELLLSDLAKGKLDIVVSFFTDLMDLSAFSHFPIADEKLLLALNQSHPLLQTVSSVPSTGQLYPHMDIRLLQNETFIHCKPGRTVDLLINYLFAKYKIAPKQRIHYEDPITTLKMAASSNCCTFTLEAVANSKQAPETLVYFTVDEPPLQWTLSAFCLRSSHITQPMWNFITLLQNTYSIS